MKNAKSNKLKTGDNDFLIEKDDYFFLMYSHDKSAILEINDFINLLPEISLDILSGNIQVVNVVGEVEKKLSIEQSLDLFSTIYLKNT